MSELFLIGTSALIRFYRRQTGAERDQVVCSGLVGICEPVRREFLRAVGGRPAYYEADGLLHDTFPYYPVRDVAWEDASALQRTSPTAACTSVASPSTCWSRSPPSTTS